MKTEIVKKKRRDRPFIGKNRSPNRKTTVRFIEEAKAVHKDRYLYDRTIYKGALFPVKIRCRVHGIFPQNPWDHLRGNGCPVCGIEAMKEKQSKTLEQFVKEANAVHDHRYSYEKAIYINSKTPLTITCKIHGPFEQSPCSHLRGAGCHQCGLEKVRQSRLKDTAYFISKAIKTHKDRYDYSQVEYIDSDTDVKIICDRHGVFFQNPINHTSGSGCPKCGKEQTAKALRKPQEQFILEAKKVHGNTYDYSQVVYRSGRKKVTIICKEHGAFEQAPAMHIQGNKCPACAGRPIIDVKIFVDRSQQVHGDYYDYSESVYQSNTKKIKIICPKHGAFQVTPHSHWKGNGCQECRKEKDLQKRRETFLINARKTHGNRYEYDLSTYIKNNQKMTIICPIHGPFETNPSTHLSGHHCKKCHLDLVKRGYFKNASPKSLVF